MPPNDHKATTELDVPDLATLRVRALDATPGPWVEHVLGSEGYDVRTAENLPGRLRRARIARFGYETWEADRANAEYVAAFDPPTVLALLDLVADLQSRLACVAEASYWDRGYDVRLDAIRGMCDLTTDGMTPASEIRRSPGNTAGVTK